MKTSPRQILIKSFLPVFAAMAIAAGFAYAVWIEPTASPPNNNVEAPINIGTTTQYKDGSLGIGGLLKAYANVILATDENGNPSGNVGVGTASPQVKLDVVGGIKVADETVVTECNASTVGTLRYNAAGKWLEFCNGASWTPALYNRYLGTTAASYDGNQGGYNAANALCRANYGTGAHVCKADEILDLGGVSILSQAGWVNASESLLYSGSYYFWKCGDYTNNSGYGDCYNPYGGQPTSGFGWSSTSYSGCVMSPTNTSAANCNTSRPFHCCR